MKTQISGDLDSMALGHDPRPLDRLDHSDRTTAASRGLVPLFSLTGGVGAALLFLVEPMMARQLLPRLGGSAAVWNTAMVFFQSALLVGYLLAHQAQRRLGRGRRVGVLALLVGGVVPLPLMLPTWSAPAGGGQAWWVLSILAVSVGVPFVALACLGPTLQAWFADTAHPRAEDPYFLYAAGNIGSVAGLLAYPLVVEPLVGLADQRRLWSIGYCVAIAMSAGCVLLRRRNLRPGVAIDSGPDPSDSALIDDDPTREVHHPSRLDRLRWIGLAAVPSAMLLAVTRHLSTDVAAIPLLWVLPLLVYLSTFIVAFRRGTQPSNRLLCAALALAVPMIATLAVDVRSIWIGGAIGIAGFAVFALVCHQALAAQRPPTQWLTSYYLWISFGGAVGGITVALVAPNVFTRVTEYPLLVLAGLAVVGFVAAAPSGSRDRHRFAMVVLAVSAAVLWVSAEFGSSTFWMSWSLIGAAALVALIGRDPRRIAIGLGALVVVTMIGDQQASLYQSRTFFGVYRVRSNERDRHIFEHGTTSHGDQLTDQVGRYEPTTYYTHTSGIGRLLDTYNAGSTSLDVAVVGLGAGTLATYGRPRDTYDFFEIDEEVVSIAKDPRLFSYLSDSSARITTTVGDGRLELASSGRRYDVIALDAFSSDAIPVHLLTIEAMRSYVDRLEPGGVIAVHISNRYFDLAPIVARLGAELGRTVHVRDNGTSVWVVIDGPATDTRIRQELSDWRLVAPDPASPLWTDDFSNLISALRR